MNRMFLVAWREFQSVVFTRGFFFGIILTPVFIGIAIGAIALVSQLDGPKVAGRLAVVDQSGLLEAGVRQQFSPEAAKEAEAATAKQISQFADQIPGKTGEMVKKQAATAAKQVPKPADLSVEFPPPPHSAASLDSLKDQIRVAKITAAKNAVPSLVAMAVIPAEAVRRDANNAYQSYELFFAPKLDFEIQSRIRERLTRAVTDARLVNDERLTQAGISPEQVRSMVRVGEIKSVTLTPEGERKTMGPVQFLIPLAFMILLMISVMTSGQYLMTAVVEEKSSRVMELLLSAVSPLQLMTGKILGQMCVGILILVVYGGLGMAGLVVFALMDLIEPIKLVWMVCYFFIAFFTVASLMAAVGSAVNELREAQTLMSPIMMLIMLPWFLWMPIQRAPNATFATIMSFVPGINPFVMVIRLGGSEPIPTWQIPASIGVGILTSVFAVWAAAKIFRIGVLMYGKPPDFRTLVKWVRMA